MPSKKKNIEPEQVQETKEVKVQANKVEFNAKDYFIETLSSIKRDGMEQLLAYLDECGFYDAPCSSQFHLAHEGGLLEHSVNVFINAENIAKSLLSDADFAELKDSVAIAALLHDLGKCGDYDKQMYVPNILKSGKQSESKPYTRNKELTAVPHAFRSIKLATLFIDLTEDEEWAILCHDGLYDIMKYELSGKETPLQMIIHWADMWASHVQEIGEQEGGDE